MFSTRTKHALANTAIEMNKLLQHSKNRSLTVLGFFDATSNVQETEFFKPERKENRSLTVLGFFYATLFDSPHSPFLICFNVYLCIP